MLILAILLVPHAAPGRCQPQPSLPREGACSPLLASQAAQSVADDFNFSHVGNEPCGNGLLRRGLPGLPGSTQAVTAPPATSHSGATCPAGLRVC